MSKRYCLRGHDTEMAGRTRSGTPYYRMLRDQRGRA